MENINLNKLILLSFGVIILMVSARIFYSGKLYYIFLIWNSFLAFIPYAISNSLLKENKKITLIICALIWLLFLPNALYLISDFEHLIERPPVPFFYDIILLFFSAIFGLFLNVISIFQMEKIANKYLKIKTIQFAVITCILLCGFGVYLGRYLRWNSWDILTNPFQLLYDCMHRIIFPLQHLRTWAVTFGYSLILGIVYFFIKLFTTSCKPTN